jgi:hypothetical protein
MMLLDDSWIASGERDISSGRVVGRATPPSRGTLDVEKAPTGMLFLNDGEVRTPDRRQDLVGTLSYSCGGDTVK